jgi:hypothetical protein
MSLIGAAFTMLIVSTDIPCENAICAAIPQPTVSFSRLSDCLAAIQSIHPDVGKAVCIDNSTGVRYYAE